MYIYILWLVLGPPYQCQLLPGSDSHETRGGWHALQLLGRVRGPFHFHLYQLSKRGTRESQGVLATVMFMQRKWLVIPRGPLTRKKPSSAFSAPDKNILAFSHLYYLLWYLFWLVLFWFFFTGKLWPPEAIVTDNVVCFKMLLFLQWAAA